mgnify:CR=1 FL=1
MDEGFRAILESLAILRDTWPGLLKRLLFPFALFCGLTLIGEVLTPGSVMQWGLLCIVAVLFAVIAVTIHRVLILGSDSVPEWGVYPVSMREIRFALYMAGVLAGFSGANALLMYPLLKVLPVFELGGSWASVGMVAAVWVLVLFLVMQFLLVFPGTAIDDNPGLRGSRELTRNRKLFLFVTVGVFPQLLLGLGTLIGQIPGLSYLWPITYVLLYVMVVAALSVAYTRIRGRRGGRQPIELEF